MDDSVMDKAALIRDRIGVGHALAYLESKGMGMEGAMDRLDTRPCITSFILALFV